jgi:hypothetical protein
MEDIFGSMPMASLQHTQSYSLSLSLSLSPPILLPSSSQHIFITITLKMLVATNEVVMITDLLIHSCKLPTRGRNPFQKDHLKLEPTGTYTGAQHSSGITGCVT